MTEACQTQRSISSARSALQTAQYRKQHSMEILCYLWHVDQWNVYWKYGTGQVWQHILQDKAEQAAPQKWVVCCGRNPWADYWPWALGHCAKITFPADKALSRRDNRTVCWIGTVRRMWLYNALLQHPWQTLSEVFKPPYSPKCLYRFLYFRW